MKVNVMNIVKIGVGVLSVGVTLAQNYLSEKELDKKVAEKVAEALAKNNQENKLGESITDSLSFIYILLVQKGENKNEQTKCNKNVEGL